MIEMEKKSGLYSTWETNRQSRGLKRLQKVTVPNVSNTTVALKNFGNFSFSRQNREGDKMHEVIVWKSLHAVRTAGKLGGQVFI